MNLEINVCAVVEENFVCYPGVASGKDNLPENVSEDDIFYAVYERGSSGDAHWCNDANTIIDAIAWVKENHPSANCKVI